ncbi:MAG: phosphatase PAP2 family protein [Candidatus Peribacteraceae bacterium]|nr:phosphatase PAP2 family protein [Candidatus Peribacteraceae bacterium]
MLNWYFVGILLGISLIGFLYVDAYAIRAVQKFRLEFHPFFLHFFRAISYTPFVVTTLFVIPLIFVIKFIDWYSAIALTIACVIATGSAFVIKYIFRRVRPLGHETYLGEIDSAFPSAHTAGSFVAAFTLSIFWPAWSAPFFVLASLIALSRIYLEMHFLSDVTGGILLAYVVVNLVLDSPLLTFLGF